MEHSMMRGSLDMQIPRPDPWGSTEAAQFRLAGFGGAALFLRSQVVPGHVFGTEGARAAYDVMLLAPDYHAWYLTRPADAAVVDWLAAFFVAAASDLTPAQSVMPSPIRRWV
jgi:hypothetical protein